MPSDASDPRRSRSRSGGDGDARRSSSRSRRPEPGSTSEKVKQAGEVATTVKETAQKAATVMGDTVGSAVDALGGWSQLDRYIKQYNPTFYEFAKDSFLKRFGATSKPSKFLLLLFALGVAQSTLPIFAWPLDYFARLLSFVFLFNTSLDLLRKGWGSGSETDAIKVKSFLTTFLILAPLEIIPLCLFDTTYHFGALWTFLLPMAMFITPDKGNPKETLAIWVADSVFAHVSTVLDGIVPDSFAGSDQTTAFLSAGVLALLLWAGLLGGTGSYILVFVVFTFATTHHVGKEYISPKTSASGFSSQMTIWHNLLAMWMWRYLVSVIEGIQIPGIISVAAWIQYHLPSYFLWMTALFFGMLLTKKTASSSNRANTWYANWFTGKSSSRPSSSSSSGSSSGQPRSSSRTPSSSSERSSRRS